MLINLRFWLTIILKCYSFIICRCYRWAKQEFRNHAFEVLAQIFWFPCCNWEKQCSRKLQWNQSLDHEESCAYGNCCSRFWSRGICCSSRRDIPIGGKLDRSEIEIVYRSRLFCQLLSNP